MSWVTSVTNSTSGVGGVDARSSMDGSGWTVSTGKSKAVGGARTQTDRGDEIAPEPGNIPPLLIVAAAGVVLLVLLRKRGAK
jgi:hypothetical protein